MLSRVIPHPPLLGFLGGGGLSLLVLHNQKCAIRHPSLARLLAAARSRSLARFRGAPFLACGSVRRPAGARVWALWLLVFSLSLLPVQLSAPIIRRFVSPPRFGHLTEPHIAYTNTKRIAFRLPSLSRALVARAPALCLYRMSSPDSSRLSFSRSLRRHKNSLVVYKEIRCYVQRKYLLFFSLSTPADHPCLSIPSLSAPVRRPATKARQQQTDRQKGKGGGRQGGKPHQGKRGLLLPPPLRPLAPPLICLVVYVQ